MLSLMPLWALLEEELGVVAGVSFLAELEMCGLIEAECERSIV